MASNRQEAGGSDLPQPRRSPEPIGAPVELEPVVIDDWHEMGPPVLVDAGCDSLPSHASNHCTGGCPKPLCICIPLPRDGWIHGESLIWWQRGMNMPPLVTSSPAGTAQGAAGVLPGASTLFGGSQVLEDSLDGVRLRFGIWLGGNRKLGVEGELFGLDEESTQFFASSSGNPILARPFFNVTPGTAEQDARLIAFAPANGDALFTGSASVVATSELRGAGVRFLSHWCGGNARGLEPLTCRPAAISRNLYGVTGWRYLSLKESLTFTENRTTTDPASTSVVTDAFHTHTQFNGFDLGLNYSGRRGRWTLDLLAKLALGVSHQQVAIAGSTVTDGVAQSPDGGFLATNTNSGVFSRDRFAVAPELGGTLGWQFAPHWKATVGYTFIYWSNVVRPGDQVDLDVGASRPEFAFNETDFWAQGVDLGLEFHW